jgi:hypothetical protein
LELREIVERAKAAGMAPLDYMLSVMRDPTTDLRDQLEMAILAAPYVHPRFEAIPYTDDPSSPNFDRIKVVTIDPLDPAKIEADAAAQSDLVKPEQ